ncbi:selenocysteine lyase/cysteine desulfurase [Algoriphagus boseongensis]|uniref:Selenocysteine lyase/cysteine desulfurase n=1 Tax=Algoriphagus boseongensis TaxID=1442587 RepID=A0A4R6TAJ4_9BACT|nr:aminotransferase class V-fold PLP-dependent enzyme [Algoriphagus boseongensis]TDQ18484.1 selenocysteine lyase/cysteine desulfurase [Algoriphagus boseongensis]
MSISCQKHLFSINPEVSYLNNAYRGPLLKSSEKAAQLDLEAMRNPFSIQPIDFFTKVERVKDLFGKLVSCQKDQVAIVPSTSYGFAVALNNWKPIGKRKAIVVKDEFPSGYFSMQRWADENKGILEVIEPSDSSENLGQSWNEKLLTAIDENTAVVLISSVHWMNGVKFDLKAIGEKCRQHGAMFIVDGTQSVGVQPIDVMECKIDALVCATYKWMLGPYSLALAYFGEKLEGGKPLEESWMNRTNSKNFSGLTNYQAEFLPHANRFDVGEVSHFVLMPMLEKSLAQILEWNPQNIQIYVRRLKSQLASFQNEQGLSLDMGDFSSNHLFSLPLKKGIFPASIRDLLEKNQIYVSLRGDSLRVSLNVFNEERDIQRLLEVLRLA